MTTEHDRQTCERKAHYSARHLAVAAASLIAVAHGDPEPLTPYECRVCGDWCLTSRGGTPAALRPHRPPRSHRAWYGTGATSAATMADLQHRHADEGMA